MAGVKVILVCMVAVASGQFLAPIIQPIPPTRENQAVEDAEQQKRRGALPCHQPLHTGNCRMRLPRWFYNPLVGRCMFFTYSGCGGNANNFPTLMRCLSTCTGGENGKIEIPPRHDTPDRVSKPQMSEKIKMVNDPYRLIANALRSRFRNMNARNPKAPLRDIGFHMNNRNFKSDIQKGFDIFHKNIKTLIPKIRKPLINLLPSQTLQLRNRFSRLQDKTVHTRAFYRTDPKKNAIMFMKFSWYGKANPTPRYKQRAEPLPAYVHREDQLLPVKNKDHGSENMADENGSGDEPKGDDKGEDQIGAIQNTENDSRELGGSQNTETGNEPPRGDPASSFISCSLPADRGPCRSIALRWFYNVQQKKCELFVYGGCGGNSNRFQTLPDCITSCSAGHRHAEKSEVEPERNRFMPPRQQYLERPNRFQPNRQFPHAPLSQPQQQIWGNERTNQDQYQPRLRPRPQSGEANFQGKGRKYLAPERPPVITSQQREQRDRSRQMVSVPRHQLTKPSVPHQSINVPHDVTAEVDSPEHFADGNVIPRAQGKSSTSNGETRSASEVERDSETTESPTTTLTSNQRYEESYSRANRGKNRNRKKSFNFLQIFVHRPQPRRFLPVHHIIHHKVQHSFISPFNGVLQGRLGIQKGLNRQFFNTMHLSTKSLQNIEENDDVTVGTTPSTVRVSTFHTSAPSSKSTALSKKRTEQTTPTKQQKTTTVTDEEKKVTLPNLHRTQAETEMDKATGLASIHVIPHHVKVHLLDSDSGFSSFFSRSPLKWRGEMQYVSIIIIMCVVGSAIIILSGLTITYVGRRCRKTGHKHSKDLPTGGSTEVASRSDLNSIFDFVFQFLFRKLRHQKTKKDHVVEAVIQAQLYQDLPKLAGPIDSSA